ncbi:MAG: hypothetical protein PHD04_00815 [Candidatus Pacebacteria bacterium]|nr:hypothetical protein [Candidatus Paceibacterota bacterium]
MKKIFLILFLAFLILFIAVSTTIADCTASVTGDWNIAATWGGGCDGVTHPDATDNVFINGGIRVTVPNGISAAGKWVFIGQTNNTETCTSTDTSGCSAIINNGTLTSTRMYIGQGASKDGLFLFGPGSTTSTSEQFFYRNGFLRSTSTRISPAIISGNAPITTSGITDPAQDVNISFVSFQNNSSIAFSLGGTTPTGSATSQLSISNCTFQNLSGITIGSITSANSTPISVTNCDIRDLSGGRNIIIRRSAGGTAAYNFSHNTLYQSVPASGLMNFSPTTSGGLTIDGNVMINVYTTIAIPGAYTVSNNLMTNATANQGVLLITDAGVGSMVTRNYLRSTADNFHPFETSGSGGSGTHTITYNVCDGIVDAIWTDKPDLLLPGANSLISDYSYNLVVGASEHIAGVRNPAFGTINIKHNTIMGTSPSANGSAGHLYTPEGVANTGTINIANNLHLDGGVLVGESIGGASSGDDQVVAYSDYNNFYNIQLANVYGAARLSITTGNTGKIVPGSHDTNINPRFLDSTRTIASWDARFGSGVGTATAGITYLLSINGYRGTPNFDQGGAISVYNPAHLCNWVSYGASPTNGLLRNAGDDGKTIGAVEWQNPRRKRM